jgi:hypothetical protein
VSPTTQEISFIKSNDDSACYLPRYNGENRFLTDEFAHLMDSQFRLLRHDLLAPLRDSSSSSTRISLRDLHCVGVYLPDREEKESGTSCFKFRFSIPEHLVSGKIEDTPPTKVVEHFNRLKWFSVDVLVSLVDAKDDNLAIIGMIAMVDEKWLSDVEKGPFIGIRFTNAVDVERMLKTLSYVNPPNFYNLTVVSKSYFSYKPILQVLQRLEPSPILSILSRSASKVAVTAEDLKLNLTNNTKVVFPKEDFSSISMDLNDWSSEKLTSSTSLDYTQAEAIHHALTSKISLIQGLYVPNSDYKYYL